MIKIVFLFLGLMLIISMIGSMVSKFLGLKAPPATKTQTRATCANCGRPVIGTAPCVCGKG